MPHHESDREDLMREATALRRRVEVRLPDEPECVIAGFRDDGSLSLYFGADPVYHFDGTGRLRRAFVDGDLYRTQGTTLARLRRVRTAAAVELRRHDLTGAKLARFLATMHERLSWLAGSLTRQEATVVRQVPEDDPIVMDVLGRIESIIASEQPLAPRIAGKR